MNLKIIIIIITVFILISAIFLLIKPVRYQILGGLLKIGILPCPKGEINRMPIIGVKYDLEWDEVLRKNCKDIRFIY